jgi:hypothetical protein
MMWSEGGQPDFLTFAGLRSGGKGGGSSSNSTSYSTNQSYNFIPSWVESGSQNLLAAAEQQAATPLQTYSGQMVADVPQDTQQAYQQVRNLQGVTDPYYQASLNQYSGLLGNLQSLTPDQQNALTNSLYGNYGQQVISPAQQYLGQAYGNAAGLYQQALGGTAGLLGNYIAGAGPATAQQVASNVNTLMNPYISNVAGPTQQIYNQMIDQQLQQNAGQAANVGAFGGSRMGVQNAVAQAQGSLGAEQYMGNLLSQGYNAALTPAYNLASQASSQGLNAAELLAGQGMTAAQQLGGFGSTAANALVSLLQGGYGSSLSGAQNIMNTNLGLGTTAAQQLPQLASAYSKQQAGDAALLQSIGQSQQEQQQAELNAQIGQYYEQQNAGYQQGDYLASILGSIPYSTYGQSQSYGTTSGTKTNTSATGSSILGGAASGAGLGSTLAGWLGLSSGTAGAAGAGIGALLGAL